MTYLNFFLSSKQSLKEMGILQTRYSAPTERTIFPSAQLLFSFHTEKDWLNQFRKVNKFILIGLSFICL